MNRLIFFWVFFIITSYASSDSIKFNNLNNHGVLGLINMPSARFFDESSYGLSIYRGDPDRKIVATFYPYDWLEGSIFYASIKGKEYGPGITQDYKDKGFNIKLRIKDEGIYPSIAIGFNDFAGTGLYSSEYIVASYGIDNIDFSFGAGWGNINGESMSKNPLSYIHDGFLNRPEIFEDEGLIADGISVGVTAARALEFLNQPADDSDRSAQSYRYTASELYKYMRSGVVFIVGQ